MKVLFEIPLESSRYLDSRFEWLSDASNRLFLIEGGKRLRTISIGTEPGKVLESANLADGRVCTSFSWNKDGNRLAMVVDKRLIYFWDVRDNNLLHYKPTIKTSSETSSTANRSRAKEVEHIVWSRVTNKVVVSYSTGQLLLCNHETNLTELFIDNSNGVLREISSIESSPHSDVFACITVIFELLVMTFDGEAIFYNQGGDHGMSTLKFSPTFLLAPAPQGKPPSNRSFWLAHNGQGTQIYFKLIQLENPRQNGVYSHDNPVHLTNNERDDEPDVDHRPIYYDWLDPSNLIVCSASGTIRLLQIKRPDKTSRAFFLNSLKLLEIHSEDPSVSITNSIDDSTESSSPQPPTSPDKPVRELFKSFKLISHQKEQQQQNGNKSDKPSMINESGRLTCGNSFSFSAMTMYRLFYYELLEMTESDTAKSRYSLEKIDELDLTGSLKRVELSLERLDWSFDSSMLAVQLTNGHILIYQTRLQDYMVSSCGPRTAYLSGANEITLLNYGPIVGESCRSPAQQDREAAAGSLELTSKASIIKVDLKPSVIAIGPRHLAVGLNNTVRFYSTQSGEFKFEEEYSSIVCSICLCHKYVTVQFSGGRVKLHPLRELHSPATDDELTLNERYFPDPTSQDSISAFTLTNQHFLYCTTSLNLYVFSLDSWAHVQSLNHRRDTKGQSVVKMVPDGKGSKYLCLTEPQSHSRCRVFLYDSYRNMMMSFLEEAANRLYARIFHSQLELVPTLRRLRSRSIPFRDLARRQLADLSRVSSVIWDSDGRSVLLVDRKSILIFVILDHTLESEGPIIEWVATEAKQSTYATLYASHGVISFQTSLGRVINSIAESHDDEVRLGRLSQQIQATIEGGRDSSDTNEKNDDLEDTQAEIMRLKLEYLQTILLIYPLSKCAEICEYIMSDGQFNVADERRLCEIDDVLWRQLAARALFTGNLQFALLVYKRRRLQVFARALAEIVEDTSRFGYDSKTSITTRLLILLGCDGCNDD